MFEYYSAECSEKCTYRIKQVNCKSLLTFLQMGHRWVWGLGIGFESVEKNGAKSIFQQLKVKVTMAATPGGGALGVRRG